MAEKIAGASRLPEYHQWAGMIARCSNERSPSWPRYGGAGISVAEEWLGHDGLMRFREHIGPKPTPKHQIDRIDNAKGYVPGNVRWATSKEQGRNKTNNRLITLDGETLCHSEWAERLGIRPQCLSARLNKWPLRKALTYDRRKAKIIAFRGETLCEAQWAARLGISHQTLQKRLGRMPLERALTLPKSTKHVAFAFRENQP